MKTISIAMATYNGAKYLSEQINSILNQTVAPNEIIIVDDCSTDGTWTILQQYAQQYNQIKLYRNAQNIGGCQSFNKAIMQCSGDYIALSDQDDVWLPEKLSILVTEIGDNLLIHSDAVIVDESLNVISNTFKKGLINKHSLVDYLMSNAVTGCTCMFSKDLVTLSFPITAEFYIHDHFISIIAGIFGTVKYIDKPLIKYRQHQNSQIGIDNDANYQVFITNRLKLGNSLHLLTIENKLPYNDTIQLIADYNLSLAKRKWISKFSIFRLLQLKSGLKYLISFFIFSGFGSEYIATKIHSFIKTKILRPK